MLRASRILEARFFVLVDTSQMLRTISLTNQNDSLAFIINKKQPMCQFSNNLYAFRHTLAKGLIRVC